MLGHHHLNGWDSTFNVQLLPAEEECCISAAGGIIQALS